MTCEDSNYQDFCCQISRYAPVCKKMDKINMPSFLSSLNNNLEAGLVLQIFELGHLFLEKKMIKFYAQGTCMYPCIRPNDILHLEPRSAAQIRVGDIAVYRRSNRLFAHRTIEKSSKDGQDYIVTRPDIGAFCNDGPCFDKDILGIVARIERNGNILGTMPRQYASITKLFLVVYIDIRNSGKHYWNQLTYLHNYLQRYKVYRAATRFLFINSKIEFGLQVVSSSRPNGRFFRKLTMGDLKKALKTEFSLPRWMITLKVGSKSAGYVSFFLKHDDCPFCGWWLCEARLMVRYRGTYVEEQFFNEVHSVLKKLEIKEVSVSVHKELGLERVFFKNMGFMEVSDFKDGLLTDKNKATGERVLMKKTIFR